MKERINTLLNKITSYAPKADIEVIRKAYSFAEKYHQTQKRASGEPYISHPLAVAEILADLKLDIPSVAAGFLHDTVEDTAATIEDIKREFGLEIARLVEGVTKLARIEVQSNVTKQAENFRKLVLAMSDDIRILLIKLADRLHNMRTLHYVHSEESRRCVALETLEIYAPLSERIGMHLMQEELQDLSFAELNSDAYETIKNRIQYLHDSDKNTVSLVIRDLEQTLKKGDIDCKIIGREKRPYSIWHKMQRKNVNFEQLSDIIAFRILVNSVADCYQVLGIVHSEYFVIPGRFKDYISTPKPNNYQSLHTHIIGPSQRQIEIQIRTYAMQEIAEYGVAAHWQYKQGIATKDGKQYRWIRSLLDILEHTSGADEFLEHTKLEMFQDQVFCFTPHGDLIALTRGGTPVDFAYAVHSDIGNRCKGVKINGKLMPLRTELRNGDQVEIITSSNHSPSPTWERFVVSGKAKANIRRFIRSKKRSQFVALGKSMVTKEGEGIKKQKLQEELKKAAAHFNLETIDELYTQIGEGRVSIKELFNFLKLDKENSEVCSEELPKTSRKSKTSKIKSPMTLQGLIPGMAIHYAGCCHPLPGEKILGVVTTGKGVTIHTARCDFLHELETEPDRLLDVAWGDVQDERYVGRLFITLHNTTGSLGSLATLIGKNQGNIVNIKVTRRHSEFFDLLLDIDVQNVQQLETILASLRSTNLITTAERM